MTDKNSINSSTISPPLPHDNQNDNQRQTNISKLLITFFFFQGGKDIIYLIICLFFGLAIPKLLLDSVDVWKKRIPGQFVHVQYKHPLTNENYEMNQFLVDPHFTQISEESVDVLLFFYSGFLPFLIAFLTLLLICCISRNRNKRFQWQWIWPEFLSFAYVYSYGFCVCFWSVYMLKYLVSSPRPDFFTRCSLNSTNTAITASNIICSPIINERELNQAWKSFPSGHTAYSFYGMTIAIYFLWGKLSFLQPIHFHFLNTYWSFDSLVVVVATFPWLISSYVAISRVRDFIHFPTDILAGALLGYICGRYAYLTQYPLSSPFSYRMLNVPSVKKYLNKYSKVKSKVFPVLKTFYSSNFIACMKHKKTKYKAKMNGNMEEKKDIFDDKNKKESDIYEENFQIKSIQIFEAKEK